MRNQEWDPALAQLDSFDLSQLVFRLFGSDSMNGEAAFRIVDQTKILAGLLNRNHIHETSWVGCVGADFAIDLDETLHDDGLGLSRVESILETVKTYVSVPSHINLGFIQFFDQPVPEKNDQRQTIAQLMRTRRRMRGVGSAQFIKQPMRRSTQAFLMLLDPTAHDENRWLMSNLVD